MVLGLLPWPPRSAGNLFLGSETFPLSLSTGSGVVEAGVGEMINTQCRSRWSPGAASLPWSQWA